MSTGVVPSLAWPRIRSRLPARPNRMIVGSLLARGHGKMPLQEGSAQSIRPLQLLSIMSLQVALVFSGCGVQRVVVVVVDAAVVVVDAPVVVVVDAAVVVVDAPVVVVVDAAVVVVDAAVVVVVVAPVVVVVMVVEVVVVVAGVPHPTMML